MPYAQVKLVCPMEGNPAPIIEWSKGEQMASTFSTLYHRRSSYSATRLTTR